MSQNTSEKKYNVLYVDDQKINLLVFEETYKSDYNVFTALSGKEGLEILNREKMDLIVSDQAMPEMTGVEFLLEVLKVQPEPNRILLTAYSDIKALSEAVNKAKIYNYVRKPWTKEELAIIFEKAINEYKLREQN